MIRAVVGVGAVLPILLVGCVPAGSGNIVTEVREVAGFDRIEVSDGIIVEITVDPDAEALIESIYDDNLQNRIVTEVDDGTLVIRGSGWGSLDVLGSGRRVEVTVPSLAGLVASGGSRATANGDGDELSLEVDGGAQADLSGFVVRAMHLAVSGGAGATVHVTGAIDGEVSGGATLTVDGDPGSSDLDVGGGARVQS